MIARIAQGACAVAALALMTGLTNGNCDAANEVALTHAEASAMMASTVRPDPSLDCLIQWMEYWEKIEKGQQAEMPSCIP